MLFWSGGAPALLRHAPVDAGQVIPEVARESGVFDLDEQATEFFCKLYDVALEAFAMRATTIGGLIFKASFYQPTQANDF